MPSLSRRSFVAATAAAMAGGWIGTRPVQALPASTPDTPWAGERIVDCHFHARPTAQSMIAHLDGAGISQALVFAPDHYGETMRTLQQQFPGRFAGWAKGSNLLPDHRKAGGDAVGDSLGAAFAGTSAIDAVAALRLAARSGARGFAETVGRVAVDGPELQRLYALAAELDLPVMMHVQTSVVPGQPAYGILGFDRIEAMLKKYPKTRFVCHASDFWGGIDASYAVGGAYPSGKVRPGGLTDRLLADHANLHGDFGAPSALMQLMRDPDFTHAFLARHQDKLLFGSDCGCSDGRGGMPAGAASSAPAATNAAPGGADATPQGSPSAMQVALAARGGLANRCIARELLTIAWQQTPREVFRKLVWSNAARVYRLPG